jgi:hypothetical protein
MAGITEDQLHELRLRYEATYDAYQSCVEALANVERKGSRPTHELLAAEAKALRELNEARERYRDALMEIAFLSDDPKR